jgi:glucosyl-3-phosphoglycerate phosphatase
VIWRHGRTPWNLEDRFQGHTDIALDEVGEAQARSAASLLAALDPSAIVSSDLQRAASTAQALADLVGLKVTLDARLRETNGGVWEGKTGAEIRATDLERYRQWRAGVDVAAGGAETRTDVADRAVAAITHALASVPDDGLLVAVTHGGTARASIGRLLGLPSDHWRVIGGLANACWSVLSLGLGGQWRLTEHNAGSLPEPVVGDDR